MLPLSRNSRAQTPQGATLEEARENLKEAVAMVLEANREPTEESLGGADVLREPLRVSAG